MASPGLANKLAGTELGYSVTTLTIPAPTVGNVMLLLMGSTPSGQLGANLSISGGGTWTVGSTVISDTTRNETLFYAWAVCTSVTTTLTIVLSTNLGKSVAYYELSGCNNASPINAAAGIAGADSISLAPSVSDCFGAVVSVSGNTPGTWPGGWTDNGANPDYWYVEHAYALSLSSGAQTVSNSNGAATSILAVAVAPSGGSTINLVAQAFSMTPARATTKGSVAITIRNVSQNFGRAGAFGKAVMALRGNTLSSGRFETKLLTQLTAFAKQAGMGRQSIRGKLTFVLRASGATAAQTLLSTVPLATLLMRSISTAFGQAKAQGKLSFKGTYLSLSSGRTFGVGKTELRGSAQSAASAVAAPKFGVKLVAHNAASTMARNSAQFIAGLKLAVFAASFGHATPGRSMVLFLRSFSSSTGLLRISGSAQFKALVRFASQAFLRFYQPTPVSPTAAFVARAAPLYYNSQFPGVFYNLIFMPGDAMPAVRDFPPIDALIQKQTLGVDFGLFLPPGVTLTGTPTVSISVTQGVDPNAAERLLASPTIGTIQPGQNGTGVIDVSLLQQVGTCLGGVDYLLVFSCDRSDGDNVVAWAHLPCVTPGSAANG